MIKELKTFFLCLVVVTGLFWAVFAHAQTSFFPVDLLPTTDAVRYLGTTTGAFGQKSWKGLIVGQICLTADVCRTTWPSGSGGGAGNSKWATSTNSVDIFPNGGLTTGLVVTSSSTLIKFNSTFSTSTNATSTNLFGTNASSTNLYSTLFFGGGLTSACQTGNVLTWSAGSFGCAADAVGSSLNPTSKWATSTIDLLAIFTSNAQRVGIGTTTPQWNLQLASSTGPQLALSDPSVATSFIWTMRNASGTLYLATSSPLSFATSTKAVFTLNPNGFPIFSSLAGVGCLQADANGQFSNTGTACGSGGGLNPNSKWATSTVDLLAIYTSNAQRVGIGTTTPQWNLQLASSTGPQLALSDPSVATSFPWTFRNASGTLYIATSSPLNYATSSTAGLTITPLGVLIAKDLSLTGNSTTTYSTTTNIFANRASTTRSTSTDLFSLRGVFGDLVQSINGTVDLAVGGTTGFMSFERNTSAGAGAAGDFAFLRSRGTVNAKTAVTSGDTLGVFDFRGFDGSAYQANAVFGAIQNAGGGADLYFGAGGAAGGGLTERMRLNGQGLLGIGTSTQQWALQVASSTGPQFALSDPSVATSFIWTQRNASGTLYFATSSPLSFATSTKAVFTINPNGFPIFSSLASASLCLTTDANGLLGTASCGSGGLIPNSKWATSTVDALAISTALAQRVGIGTTTPAWNLQLASSTGPQLSLTDSSVATFPHWTMRNAGGNLYFATSSALTYATTSPAAMTLSNTGVPSITVGTTTCQTTLKNGSICLGGGGDTNGKTGSTTISMGKIQFDGMENGGARVCVYVVGTTLTVSSGACTP